MTRSTKRLLPIPGLASADEQTMAMIVALTSEVTVLRARLDAFERIAEVAGLVSRSDIDAFVPDAAADVERAALRRRTLSRVFRALREAGEADLAAQQAV
ncbi:hypothetical protein [Sphingobium sp.]|uniref:hypothetical protein n=1 Tax=Sphingobium sp. TaxID=1912891 RepID=UPI003BB72E71